MSDLFSAVTLSDLIGWLVGIAGLLYALYANREAKKVRDIARSDAWNLYQLTNVTCGKVQETLKLYKAAHAEDSKVELVEELSKADALSLQSYLAAIRHIQMVEPVFDIPLIKYWVKSEKIPDHQEVDFRKFVVDKKVAYESANN